MAEETGSEAGRKDSAGEQSKECVASGGKASSLMAIARSSESVVGSML